MSKRTLGAGRSLNTLGLFRDHETDWLFKRTLEYAAVGCAEIGECLYAARRINERDVESWIREWADLARKVEAQGDESLSRGHHASARASFLRAMNYYRTAEYACAPSHDRFDELWQKSVSCMQKAAPLFNPPIQRVMIPFEGKMLPAYFWRPEVSEVKRPTLIIVGGTDSSGEEMLMIGAKAATERGYNFFTFEYPGHRGAVHLDPACIRRPDYEVPFKAAIDYLETLPGVDERLALGGFSYGGYVAARVAIYEKRIKAVIPDSPIIDLPEIAAKFWGPFLRRVPVSLLDTMIQWKTRSSPITRNFMRYGAWLRGYTGDSLARGLTIDYSEYNIRRDLSRITCPTLALAGAGEGEVMIRQAREFYEGVSSKIKKLYIFTQERDGSDDHCQLDNITRGMQIMFDWLDEILKP